MVRGRELPWAEQRETERPAVLPPERERRLGAAVASLFPGEKWRARVEPAGVGSGGRGRGWGRAGPESARPFVPARDGKPLAPPKLPLSSGTPLPGPGPQSAAPFRRYLGVAAKAGQDNGPGTGQSLLVPPLYLLICLFQMQRFC